MGTELDNNGHDCKYYINNSGECGDHDNFNFRAYEMCCSCDDGTNGG